MPALRRSRIQPTSVTHHIEQRSSNSCSAEELEKSKSYTDRSRLYFEPMCDRKQRYTQRFYSDESVNRQYIYELYR